MQLTKEEIRNTYISDKRRERRRMFHWFDATVGAFGLCWFYKLSPMCYGTQFLSWKLAFMSFAAGAALAISGLIFQTAYRNPMASPNILGATAGVGLGNVLMVSLYGGLAMEKIQLRYEYCYGFTFLCLILVLLLGKYAGDKSRNYSIMEMVMLGSIVSQGVSVVTRYLMYNLEDEDLLTYQELSLGTYINEDPLSIAIFFIVMAVSIIPILLVRYRMNAIGMERMETNALGIRIRPLRLVGQLCGVIMVACAMIHCGQIGMISMVVPYVVRQLIGSDFRKVLIYSALGGGIIVMLSRVLTLMIVINNSPIPVTFIINIVLTPVFMVILAKQKGVGSPDEA